MGVSAGDEKGRRKIGNKKREPLGQNSERTRADKPRKGIGIRAKRKRTGYVLVEQNLVSIHTAKRKTAKRKRRG